MPGIGQTYHGPAPNGFAGILRPAPLLAVTAAGLGLGACAAQMAMNVSDVVTAGAVLGFCASRILRWAGCRSAGNARLLVGGAVVVTLVALYAASYVWFVREVSASWREEFSREPAEITDAERALRASVIADFAADPYGAVDRWYLEPATGRTGFLGYLVLRAQRPLETQGYHYGAEIGRAQIPGIFFMALEAVVAWTAALWLGRLPSAPPCDRCTGWFGAPKSVLTTAGGDANAVADAVRTGDPAQLAALQSLGGVRDDDPGVTVVRLHVCDGCGQMLAEVVRRDFEADGMREEQPVPPMRIAPETAAALGMVAEHISSRPREVPEDPAVASDEKSEDPPAAQ